MQHMSQGGYRGGTSTLTNASLLTEVKSRSFFHFQACQWVIEQGVKKLKCNQGTG